MLGSVSRLSPEPAEEQFHDDGRLAPESDWVDRGRRCDDWRFPGLEGQWEILPHHRRRMEREAKAKVVTPVWGQNLFNSLPR